MYGRVFKTAPVDINLPIYDFYDYQILRFVSLIINAIDLTTVMLSPNVRIQVMRVVSCTVAIWAAISIGRLPFPRTIVSSWSSTTWSSKSNILRMSLLFQKWVIHEMLSIHIFVAIQDLTCRFSSFFLFS